MIWLVLALPGLLIAWRALSADAPLDFTKLSYRTAEWSAYLFILCLCATPLCQLCRGKLGSRFLVRKRRYIGVAAFVYGVLHTLCYIIHVGGLWVALSRLSWPTVWTGLVVLALLIPVAWTSRDASVRRLGTRWKRVQQLVYPAAVLTFIHWAIQFRGLVVWEAALWFSPLLLLSVFRLARPRLRARARP
ncbi:hypothetical protein BV911_05680 [Pseudoruegeria sp. SK021]|nr:hypothetical protein BV911_05680 [Pseudoruegeria sp. SK021]